MTIMGRVDEHLAVDPDVDLHDAQQRAELTPHSWPVLGAISVGGALGALARHGMNVWVGLPWSTFAVNVIGCLLIGALMVLISARWPRSRLIRPFFGVGVLGGFTTFSAYVLDFHQLSANGHLGVAVLYLAGTVVSALGAVWLGMTAARRLVTR